MTEDEDVPEADIPVSSGLGVKDEVLQELGKNALLESTNVIKDFIKLMIPLTTGVIPVYFALLKFIGIEDINSMTFSYEYLGPPFLFLVSLVAFIAASFPRRMNLDIENKESIMKFIAVSSKWKYVCSVIGAIFFTIGILGMIYWIGFVWAGNG